MPDKPFVINDRRKFTADGELRPDAPHDVPREPLQPITEPGPEAPKGPQLVSEATAQTSEQAVEPGAAPADDTQPPPLTADQIDQAKRAYDATAERLDIAVRSMNPGGEHPPAMSFERFIQSLYMQTLIQLGGVTEPGQPAQVDPLGARSTIDMLAIIEEKTRGSLSESDERLVQNALFELRLGFLDVVQELAKQAASRQGQPGAPGTMPPPPGGGPSLIR